jgi:hypothetical protein
MSLPNLLMVEDRNLYSDSISTTGNSNLSVFDFGGTLQTGLLVVAGGFERRARAFTERLRVSRTSINESLLMQYESQVLDNDPNRIVLESRLERITGKKPEKVFIHAQRPLESSVRIRKKIEELAVQVVNRKALIDVSGMTHLWALTAIDTCLALGFQTSIVYTEAKWYFPSKRVQKRLVKAWRESEYEVAVQYLQSAGLDNVHIPPEFAGNFRPGRQTCLIIFVGYEPNRIQGLIEDYAAGALIVLYGCSPHHEMDWRTQLSKNLHQELFDQWLVRQQEISTLEVDAILTALEKEFEVIRDQYDVAISPQCSKMQALASYLFWRRHPEVQLVFTSPVNFNPDRYSKGVDRSYIYRIN